jgi:hypothetical protein
MPLLEFARAAAFFNGDPQASLQHVGPLLAPVIGPKFELNGETSKFWLAKARKSYLREKERRHIDREASIRRLWADVNAAYDRDVKDARKPWTEAMERFAQGFDGLSIAEARELAKDLWKLLASEQSLKAANNPYIYFTRLQLRDMHNKARTYIAWKEAHPDGR